MDIKKCMLCEKEYENNPETIEPAMYELLTEVVLRLERALKRYDRRALSTDIT